MRDIRYYTRDCRQQSERVCAPDRFTTCSVGIWSSGERRKAPGNLRLPIKVHNMVYDLSSTSKPRGVSCGPQVYRAIIECWCDARRKATYGFGWTEMKRTIPNEHRRQVPLCLDAPLGSWPSHTPSESTTAGRLAVRSFLSDTRWKDRLFEYPAILA
jgi:hypothetical protein